MARITNERTSVGPTGVALSTWLAEYVRGVARTEGRGAARQRAAHLGLFLTYLRRRGLGDLSLPWWEYVDALAWIRRRMRGSSSAAARVLDTLRDFHATLERAGHLAPAWELERATAILRGGRRLRGLVTLASTGAETWRLWRTADGQLAPISFADRWLGLLWERSGRSWAAVRGRLRASSAAATKLASLRALRTRLETGHAPDPGHLAACPVRIAELEALTCWLGGPLGGPSIPPSVDDELGTLPTGQLVDRLAASAATIMPRREMAELRRRGDGAIAPLLSLVANECEVVTPLWAIIVLGELRATAAVEPLVASLDDADGAVAEAAAEALGRIGRGALPAVLAATRGPHDQRLHAWAALGLLRTARAHRALQRGLARDPHFADVIARALARHGRRDAIPALQAALRVVPVATRRALEAAIFVLVHGAPPREPFERDWRLRYRPLPGLGGRFPWGWTGIAALAHRHFDQREGTAPVAADAPTRPLAAILADPRLVPDDVARCHRCGGRTWRPTGLLACRHTAASLVRLQRAALARLRAAGVENAWRALDGCDRREAALIRRARDDTRAAIAIERATLYWLLARGVEELAAGERLLDVAAGELAALYRSPASDRELVADRDG